MKWGRQRHFKQHRQRRALIQIRQEIASTWKVPYNLIFDNKNTKSSQYFRQKLHEINAAFIQAYNEITNLKKLPRKLKKQHKKSIKRNKMKIKVVSDLHTENLTDFDFIEEGNFDALFIAGDISTRIEVEQNFLKQFKKPVYVVAGNHLGYKFDTEYLFHKVFCDNIDFLKNDTHPELIKRLTTLNILPNIHYLQNTYTDLGNFIVYGGVMYTNFELYGKKNIKACLKEAEYYINDFRKLYKYNKGFSLITPKDYRRYFNKFIKGLKQCLQETNKDIIVLTHFCPSLKSINTEYYNELDLANSCFASNLDKFILDNPRIKLWVHGHTHSACDYTIGQCRVVCNPFGYLGENYTDYKEYKEVIVEI